MSTTNRTLRKLVLFAGAAALLVWPALLTGCNTVAGAGEDIASLGRGTTRLASDTCDWLWGGTGSER